MPPKKANAIHNVVTDLIRAAAGASAKDVADEDVDKYVADLILKEAEEKRKKYNAVGVRAYQPEPSTKKPKPNTRFLLNVVKATDSHNQAVIRTNEKNVARWRQERLERESTRKRARSPESSRPKRSPSPRPCSERKKKQDVVPVRGRGKVRLHTSSMDKYFSKGYDPLLDMMDSEEEEEKKKKHKSEKKKKKHKKEKQ
ncbi:hypothetical protein BD560DRAFT_387028 [Blakeslea trispora]|nr:hypothetical protein BD560DRAFT_387028 [Blakeslea trispora]